MKNVSWRSVLFLTTLLLWIGAASAQGSLNLTLPRGEHSLAVITIELPSERAFDLYNHCRGGVATTIFTHANHPGPNNGRFEENNDGWDGRCYLNKNKNFYWALKTLINSQGGDTLGFGGGLKVRPLEVAGYGFIHQVALDIGIEGSIIYYAKRFNRGAVIAPLIAPYIGLSATVGGIEIGMIQYWLPENIVIRGNTFDDLASVVGAHGLYPSQPGWPLTAQDQTRRNRPMVFLRYTF